MTPPLSHRDLLQLKRWNTPTIYNGWEQITRHDAASDAFNLEPVTDFMPAMGPMVGWATTVVIEPSVARLNEASQRFRDNTAERFSGRGEW